MYVCMYVCAWVERGTVAVDIAVANRFWKRFSYIHDGYFL